MVSTNQIQVNHLMRLYGLTSTQARLIAGLAFRGGAS
jgi:hypothetical protein